MLFVVLYLGQNMWITIEQIQCLKAIRESGSLNGAAEILNKAKSAVSYSIHRLEEQLGFEALDRSQYRIHLTPQGEAFLKKSQPILKELEKLKAEVHKIGSGVETKLSLSATAVYPSKKINSVLQEIIHRFPSTEFTFHREILSGEKMLMEEQVDIAIFESLQNSMDIESKKIDQIDLKLTICSKHPFLKLPRKRQSLEALSQFPQIIQRSTIPTTSAIGIIEGAKHWSVSDIDSKKELILNNLGWGRLPDHYIKNELASKKLIHLNHLQYDHTVDIFICRKKNQPVGPVLKHIWDSF